MREEERIFALWWKKWLHRDIRDGIVGTMDINGEILIAQMQFVQ